MFDSYSAPIANSTGTVAKVTFGQGVADVFSAMFGSKAVGGAPILILGLGAFAAGVYRGYTAKSQGQNMTQALTFGVLGAPSRTARAAS
jgi:hypothetical protein